MIILGELLTEPVTKAGPGPYAGATFTFRRLQSPELDEAYRAAQSVMAASREALAALEPYGFGGQAGAPINTADPIAMMRAGHIIGAVEILVRALAGWTGIVLDRETRALAPIDRNSLAMLVRDDLLRGWLIDEVDAAARILVVEGKGSGSSPIGSSGTPPKTTGGRATARVAKKAASPAPAASRAAPAASARKSPTRRGP